MVEGNDFDGMTEEIKTAGATAIVQNDDGSASVTISQEKLNQLLQKYEHEMTDMINGLQSDANSSAVKALGYDQETFRSFDLTVDRAAYESDEDGVIGLAVFGLAMQGLMYQVYAGLAVEESPTITFNFIDTDTGEVFYTETLPQP